MFDWLKKIGQRLAPQPQPTQQVVQPRPAQPRVDAKALLLALGQGLQQRQNQINANPELKKQATQWQNDYRLSIAQPKSPEEYGKKLFAMARMGQITSDQAQKEYQRALYLTTKDSKGNLDALYRNKYAEAGNAAKAVAQGSTEFLTKGLIERTRRALPGGNADVKAQQNLTDALAQNIKVYNDALKAGRITPMQYNAAIQEFMASNKEYAQKGKELQRAANPKTAVADVVNAGLMIGPANIAKGAATGKTVSTGRKALDAVLFSNKPGVKGAISTGARQGAIGGAANAWANDQNVLGGAITGAVTGGALGGGVDVVSRGAGKAVRATKQELTDLRATRLTDQDAKLLVDLADYAAGAKDIPPKAYNVIQNKLRGMKLKTEELQTLVNGSPAQKLDLIDNLIRTENRLRKAETGALGENVNPAELPNKAQTEATPQQKLSLEIPQTPQTPQSLSLSKSGDVQTPNTSNLAPQIAQQQAVAKNLPQTNNNTSGGIKQQRGFKSNLAADARTPHKVFSDIPGYTVKTNAKTIEAATQRVASDAEGTYNRLIQEGAKTVEDKADALVLLRKLVEDDNLDRAQALANATAKSATDAGQAVQIFASFKKTTPDGALRDVYNMVNAHNKSNPNKKPIGVTKEQASKITKLASELQDIEYGTRDWAVKAAQLEREKALVIPKSFLAKVSTVQTMSQLMNPKTLVRNVIGNTVADVAEDTSRVFAAGFDKVLYAIGGVKERNAVLPSIRKNWLGKYTGFKEGLQDVKLGIRTQGSGGKYDIAQEVFKPGSVGNKLEKLLGYELSAFDKAFYTGRYEATIDNLLKAKKLKVATPEIKAVAEAEALYATFQNNSTIANALSSTKRILNNNKEWGLGDLILKYPKTPGNLVSVGLDYSPVGMFKGIKGLYDGIKQNDTRLTRNAELNIGRAFTGSGLIIGGAFLAKSGIITGKAVDDKDQRAALQAQGQGPFTFNVTALGRLLRGEDTKPRKGDITMNYDWLQPNAIQISMGANMVINNGNASAQINDALGALGSGIDTISEQPVFQGVKQFFGNMNSSNGGGIGKAVQGVISDVPSSFVPSIVNQAGQMTDNTARSTYSPNVTEQALNKVKARLPFLRKTLQPSLNTLGEERKQYDVGGNNPLNILLNPGFMKRIPDQQAYNLAQQLFESTGDTSAFPRQTDTTITVNKKSIKLTPKQLADYQRYVGTETKKAYQQAANDPRFNALSDQDKVKTLQNILTDINSAAKIKLFGSEQKPTSTVKQITEGNSTSVDARLEPTKKKATTPRESYINAKNEFEKNKSSMSEAKQLKAQKALRALEIKSKYSQDIVDLYSLSKNEILDYAATKANGQDILKQLQQLDAELGSTKLKKLTKTVKRGTGVGTSRTRKVRVAKARVPKASKVRITKLPTGRIRVKKAPKLKVGRVRKLKIKA